MFKETATEKLIEYIRALPAGEQKIIARKIGAEKSSVVKNIPKGMKDFIAYTKTYSGRLHKNYKFNREEANER